MIIFDLYITGISVPYITLFHLWQNLINRQWVGLPGEDKMEIRGTLNRFLLSHHETVATFIRNKLVKLVVDIGRLDWPHFYPDFFSSILQVQTVKDISKGFTYGLYKTQQRIYS